MKILNKHTCTLLLGCLIAAATTAQQPAKKTTPAKPAAKLAGKPAAKPSIAKTNMNDTTRCQSGLKIKFKKRGTGITPATGDNVTAHYIGKLVNGTVFDSGTYTFELGLGRVIRGWDEGFGLMKVGDEATLIIPSYLGYGPEGSPPAIPGNSVLLFDVKFLKCEPNPNNTPVNLTGLDVQTTPSGLKYYFIQRGNGRPAKAGQKVSIHYVAKLMTGFTFESSRESGKPITFSLGKGQVFPGWDEGIALMNVGDKAFFVLPPELALGSRSAGPIPPNATLAFEIELIDAQDPVEPTAYDVAGKDTVTTASGLKYIVVSRGTGPKAENGKMTRVHYTGRLLDGKVFDSSVDRGEPIEFQLGARQVIAGWDEGILLMNQGDKFRLIIPPGLAYGNRSMGSIPANSTLVFDVELMPEN